MPLVCTLVITPGCDELHEIAANHAKEGLGETLHKDAELQKLFLMLSSAEALSESMRPHALSSTYSGITPTTWELPPLPSNLALSAVCTGQDFIKTDPYHLYV